MAWYAIRRVYHFGTKGDGTNVFEERVVCFEANSWADAHAKSNVESEEYARNRQMEIHPEHSGYEQDGAALIDGYEVWSELFESKDSLTDFYARRYAAYEYHPELPV